MALIHKVRIHSSKKNNESSVEKEYPVINVVKNNSDSTSNNGEKSAIINASPVITTDITSIIDDKNNYNELLNLEKENIGNIYIYL